VDLRGLRATVNRINFAVHGVPARVAGIATRIIWLAQPPLEVPQGSSQRIQPHRSVAISREEIPALPVGTLITAAVRAGDPETGWRVDAIDGVEAYFHRCTVVPA
jgi:hypothetical protein